jgi:hypothetical protein
MYAPRTAVFGDPFSESFSRRTKKIDAPEVPLSHSARDQRGYHRGGSSRVIMVVTRSRKSFSISKFELKSSTGGQYVSGDGEWMTAMVATFTASCWLEGRARQWFYEIFLNLSLLTSADD